MIKSTATSGAIFPNTYYKNGVDVGYNAKKPVSEMTIVYFARPAVKTSNQPGNVMVPYEFTDLVRAKLRGEAYKLCNEDAVAAKWLSDYNSVCDCTMSGY